MPFIYAVIFGGGLGVGSVFLHASLPPFGLLLSFTATCAGIWSIGRMWGGRKLRIIASCVWRPLYYVQVFLVQAMSF